MGLTPLFTSQHREEKLQEQLAVHKEALAELYQLHLNLKEKLKYVIYTS